ncbi:MAG: type II secretion system F family protein [archaeon]
MNYENMIYNLIPRWYKELLDKEARYAGHEFYKETFVSRLFMVFYTMAFLDFFILYGFSGAPLWLSIIPPLLIMIVGFGSPYIIYSVVAEARRKNMEQLLPDMLLLTASNIKSGLTIDRALLFSARPEFGDLGQEFRRVAFEIYGGQPIDESFQSLTKKVKSCILERTVGLLVEGLRSGGAVAKLLEETAVDIRNTETLQKEIQSSVMMYIMFIFMAAVLGAPFLFAISSFLVSSTVGMWQDMDFDTEFADTGMLKMSKPDIDLDLFNYFSIAALVITTFFAGLLISLIQSGNLKGGIKYVPIFVSLALLINYGAKTILFMIFGDMLGLT